MRLKTRKAKIEVNGKELESFSNAGSINEKEYKKYLLELKYFRVTGQLKTSANNITTIYSRSKFP